MLCSACHACSSRFNRVCVVGWLHPIIVSHFPFPSLQFSSIGLSVTQTFDSVLLQLHMNVMMMPLQINALGIAGCVPAIHLFPFTSYLPVLLRIERNPPRTSDFSRRFVALT